MSGYPLGRIDLQVTLREGENTRSKFLTFEIVDFESAYNCILGRLFLKKFMAVTHFANSVLKVPGPRGPMTIYDDRKGAAALAGRPVLRDLLVHLKLSSNSNHITCMIINCSLHGYIRTCRLHVGTFFYSLFSFYPWGWPRCVSTILNYRFYPCHELWSIMQVWDPIYVNVRLGTSCPPLEKYK